MKKQRIIFIIICIVILIIGLFFINRALNPLRKSEAEIREYLFEFTPIGSTKEQVIDFINDNAEKHYPNASPRYLELDYGFAIKDDRVVLRFHGAKYDDSEMIGSETLEAEIGTYYKFFKARVIACWAFDESEKLIDIGVYKGYDSL